MPPVDYDGLVSYLKSTGADDTLAQTAATNLMANPNSPVAAQYTQLAQQWVNKSGDWRKFTQSVTDPMNDEASAQNGDYKARMRNDMREGHGNPDLYQQMTGSLPDFYEASLPPAERYAAMRKRQGAAMSSQEDDQAFQQSVTRSPSVDYPPVSESQFNVGRRYAAQKARAGALAQQQEQQQRTAAASAPIANQLTNQYGADPMVASQVSNQLMAPLAGNSLDVAGQIRAYVRSKQ